MEFRDANQPVFGLGKLENLEKPPMQGEHANSMNTGQRQELYQQPWSCKENVQITKTSSSQLKI